MLLQYWIPSLQKTTNTKLPVVTLKVNHDSKSSNSFENSQVTLSIISRLTHLNPEVQPPVAWAGSTVNPFAVVPLVVVLLIKKVKTLAQNCIIFNYGNLHLQCFIATTFLNMLPS